MPATGAGNVCVERNGFLVVIGCIRQAEKSARFPGIHFEPVAL
jgi:hypothetical protein